MRTTLTIALLGAALAAGACSRTAATAPRHVILISLDTTRADQLACYGAPAGRTPSLDRLAARGALFEDATTPAPTTLAAHTSLMTGTPPHTHGVPRNGFVVDPANTMLAEVLRDAGFRTIAVLGSFALERRFGFDQGFDVYDEEFDMVRGDGRLDQNQRRAERVTDAALRHVDGEKAEHLFLFVHYFDAHAPYEPPPPFDQVPGRPDAPREATLRELEVATATHQKADTGRALGVKEVVTNGLTDAILDGAKGEPIGPDADYAALYAGEVSYVDRELGRLLDGLEERGLLRDALVIVTADHGETFWEHGDAWNHGLCTYQTTVHVPLIVATPLGDARRVAEPVSTLDVAPTVVELLGLPRAGAMQGASLAPLLEGRARDGGPVFSEATQPSASEHAGAWFNADKAKCVRLGPWKYVWTPYLRREELYDLEHDPGERSNLLAAASPAARAKADELRAQLDAWCASAHPFPTHRNPRKQGDGARLEQMGYADSAPGPGDEDH